MEDEPVPEGADAEEPDPLDVGKTVEDVKEQILTVEDEQHRRRRGHGTVFSLRALRRRMVSIERVHSAGSVPVYQGRAERCFLTVLAAHPQRQFPLESPPESSQGLSACLR